MGPDQVTRLKGKPTSIEAYYPKDKDEYYAKFENGRVVRFAPMGLRCVDALCTPYVADDDK